MPSEGPRHAAPRKPLLARLHMPAGKAVALVAMPSAVLMGMGLTPTLAAAKPAPKKLFDGACATAPDTVAESESPDAGKSAGPSGQPSEKPSEKPSGKPSSGPGAAPSAGASAPAGKQKKPAAPEKAASPEPAASAGSPSPAPSPSPSASKAGNPLDPLGLGDKLHDILTGGAKPPAAGSPNSPGTPSPAAPPSSAAPAPKPSAQPEKGKGAEEPKAGEKAKEKAGDEDKATEAPSASTSAGPAPSTSASPQPGTGDGELPPCPKGSVVDENEHHAFPNQPWYLEASKLTLTGLTYEGVKKITMVNGQKKDVLKFTADSLAIKDLHQIVNSQGKQYHVAGIGTESTVTGGKITMYTEELKGNLLGIIPATHSPGIPPPLIPGLKLPIPVFYTNVKIRQAGQFGGTLHIPNLHQYTTDGTYP
ncbi:hypothetical protein [Streptomyces roseoverticillatus]|uniref:Hydrogenase expression protein HypF n=1 Tax=Streptomyces roseoverticillatus TaxID=66429 RepID=A0ABV3IYU5_9ACTN